MKKFSEVLKIIFIIGPFICLNVWADDSAKIRANLELEVKKLEPEVAQLRTMSDVKKQRDDLKRERKQNCC